MDFVTQVKKLKDMTKSPKVKELCERFLTGNGITKEQLVEMINNQNSAIPQLEVPKTSANHVEVRRKEETEVSKKAASQLMESWQGLKSKTTSQNSGTWINQNQENTESGALLENVDFLSSIDSSARSFVEAQNMRNLGVLNAINKIKESSIYSFPKAKIICEQYNHLLSTRAFPEFLVIENFVQDLKQLSWDSEVSELTSELDSVTKKFAREIQVSKVLEALKTSGNASFYSELKEAMNGWLLSGEKSSAVLVKQISKYNFNPVVRNLVNYLNVYENEDSRKLELPDLAQGESRVSRLFSPVIMESGNSTFLIGGTVFEANSDGIRKLSIKEVSSLDPEFLATAQIMSKPNVKVNENGISVQLGKKTVRIVEHSEGLQVFLGNTSLHFQNLAAFAKILGLESSSHFGVNESQVVSDIIMLFKNATNIVELDFAKSIVSNVYEGVSVNLIKWEGKIFLQRINESMRENSIFEVNGTQAVKMVKDFMRYDISEGLTGFLEGEQKIKSIMVNDRTAVLENISKVEAEIFRVKSLMESNSLYKLSAQMNGALHLLENELSVLKEKWNQINSEIRKIEEATALEIPQINEDQKFNIGDFVKVKESGETGKIISVDGTSGRYTVLLDNGKTSDFLINEIADLEDALSQAAQDNVDAGEEDGEEEVKESNNLNKSTLSIEEQKGLLKKFADMHSFSKAPKSEENDEIQMELDSLHGYNITMNEAKHKAEKGNSAPDFSKAPGDSKLAKGKDANKGNVVEAPGNDKKVKGKTEGEKLLAKAPGKSDSTDFEGEDAAGEKYDIGYNIREGKDLAEAPETGKSAKETKGTAKSNLVSAPGHGSAKDSSGSSSLTKHQNLAEAPGVEGDIDYEVNAENGYNVSEADSDEKKN
jgi:hypothetical protein